MAQPHKLPTAETLNQIFKYNYITGELRWRFTTRTHKANKPTGRYDRNGYICTSFAVNGKKIRTANHRIIWKMFNSTEPFPIDHINRRKDDNRLLNLRPSTIAKNAWNCEINKRNTSGCAGVGFDKRRGLWRARITKHSKEYHLGYFKCSICANLARKMAEVQRHSGDGIKTYSTA